VLNEESPIKAYGSSGPLRSQLYRQFQCAEISSGDSSTSGSQRITEKVMVATL